MGLTKCPRCELNYILDGEKLCTVCRREVRGEPEINDMPELCSECGEHPVMPGSELCVFCMKEMNRRVAAGSSDAMEPEETPIELDSGVSSMDEIELDIDDELDSPFGEDFKDDEEEDEDGDVSIDSLREKDDKDDDEDEDN